MERLMDFFLTSITILSWPHSMDGRAKGLSILKLEKKGQGNEMFQLNDHKDVFELIDCQVLHVMGHACMCVCVCQSLQCHRC